MKVGITGHQNLTTYQSDWLTNALKSEIRNIKIDEAYSCLAIGADQIFAKVFLENRIPLIAVIPCKRYHQTFKENYLQDYEALIKEASNVIQLDFENPSEQAFYEAGKFIVDNSDILFAFWNNLPSKGLGGTADIVLIAEKLKKKIIHLNPITKTINYINYGN